MEMKIDLAYVADEEYTATNASGNEVAIDFFSNIVNSPIFTI